MQILAEKIPLQFSYEINSSKCSDFFRPFNITTVFTVGSRNQTNICRTINVFQILASYWKNLLVETFKLLW